MIRPLSFLKSSAFRRLFFPAVFTCSILSDNVLLAQDTIVEIKPFMGSDNKPVLYSIGYLNHYYNYEMYSGSMALVSSVHNRGFVTFDLTKLPANAIIKNVVFKSANNTGGLNAVLSGMGTVTGLADNTLNGMITKADIETGPVYANQLDWNYVPPPQLISDFTPEGIVAVQKKIGAAFSVGINPPNKNDRNLSGTALLVTYELSTAQPKPIADFSAFKEAYKGDEIRFTDNSSYYPTQWFWDFGDGATSTDRNPVHMYPDTGRYTVKLRVTNASGSDSIQKINYMEIAEKPSLLADFASDEVETYAGVPVTFYDSTSNNPDSWYWDFGDGKTATLKNPSHTYNEIGLYTVTLIAKKKYAPASYPYSSIYIADTAVKHKYINVIDPSKGPFADFGIKKINDRTVTFGDSSYNVPETWSWDFDAINNPGVYDSQVQNPIFTYAAYGTYTVCLIVSNDVGKDTICKEIQVIDPATGVAAFPGEEIRLYPNPARDMVYIRLSGIESPACTITLHNMLGQQISQQMINEYTSVLPFDVSELSRGCYFLSIKSDRINKSVKLILNR